MEISSANSAAALFADFATKVKDLDEKHEGLKEKMLLLSQSFIKQEDRISKEISFLRDDIREIMIELEKIKEGIQHIIKESAGFARKEEIQTMERYMKIWEPLKMVNEDDVKRMIEGAIKKRK